MELVPMLERNRKVGEVNKSPRGVEFDTVFAGPTLPTDLVSQIDKETEQSGNDNQSAK